MTHPVMPSIAEISAAAATVRLIIEVSQNKAGYLQDARRVFEPIRSARERFLTNNTTAIVFADATRADLAALFAAEAVGVVIGDAFSVADADDTTDNALEAAKGAAVANKDVFQRTGAAAVKYLGPTPLAIFATMDNALAD